MADTPKRPLRQDASAFPSAHAALLDPLYTQSGAARWHLPREPFLAALSRCILKALSATAIPDSAVLERLLAGLHLEDLALACACAEGQESAWEYFVATYRPYLRASAAVILRCAADAPEATELADSLFAELYGVSEGKRGQGGLFRYFHGRSSLKTWLRAVLAQRHIDRIRATRRFSDLDDGETSAAVEKSARTHAHPADPHRDRYLAMFHRALEAALHSLDPHDTQRLTHYYRDDKTLAEIGRLLGEHESSVSRNLERVRRSLRVMVEAALRAGFSAVNGSSAEPGLSDAEIALCLEYAAEDSGINLDTLFPSGSQPRAPESGRRQS